MPLLEETPYFGADVPDWPQCTPQALRVIHVGAGASGLLFAHKAEKFLKNFTLVCYEKNRKIGGTWYENKYPGCGCDIPAHGYTYPFEPSTEWSSFYSGTDEVEEYFSRFAKKYGVEKYVQFNTEVLSATWEKDRWSIELRKEDGSTFTDHCDVLVNGSGVINKWKWPAVPGLHDFTGTLAHSAAWDTNIDWKDKTIAVIGSGSSSIQMVPQFAATAKHMTVFIRNRTYIGPPAGASVSNKEADPEAMDPVDPGKHQYTEKEKQRFRKDPEYHLKYRRALERTIAGTFEMFIRGTPMNKGAKEGMQAMMEARLKDHDEIKKQFIPSWSPGCRRLTPGEGYLEALISENVSPLFQDIEKVVPEGVMSADGTLHKVDIIACATGFDVQFVPHFRITGLDSQVMQDTKSPNVYASVAVPGFPNYFAVNGARGNWGNGCALPSHEVQVEYILQCCAKLQQDSILYMQPRLDYTTQLNLYMDAWHKKRSVWAEECKSWYKDNKPDGRVWVWSGSLYHHLKFMKRPRFEHYEITYRRPENIWQFLGNGMTITEETMPGETLPVPYIRNNEDEQWDIE